MHYVKETLDAELEEQHKFITQTTAAFTVCTQTSEMFYASHYHLMIQRWRPESTSDICDTFSWELQSARATRIIKQNEYVREEKEA